METFQVVQKESTAGRLGEMLGGEYVYDIDVSGHTFWFHYLFSSLKIGVGLAVEFNFIHERERKEF